VHELLPHLDVFTLDQFLTDAALALKLFGKMRLAHDYIVDNMEFLIRGDLTVSHAAAEAIQVVLFLQCLKSISIDGLLADGTLLSRYLEVVLAAIGTIVVLVEGVTREGSAAHGANKMVFAPRLAQCIDVLALDGLSAMATLWIERSIVILLAIELSILGGLDVRHTGQGFFAGAAYEALRVNPDITH
jgi:hypothetical protein